MTALAARAEVIKLARELRVEPTEIDFLKQFDAADLRRFRSAIGHRLNAPHGPMVRRVAAASRLVPNPIIIRIATRVPALCGLVAPELAPDHAASLINGVSAAFAADVSAHIDPERAEPIIRALAVDQLIPIVQEMLRRKDYATLGRFVSSGTDEQLLGIAHAVDSGEDLLMTGFFAEAADRFDLIVRNLTAEQIRSIISAADDLGRFPEALTILQALRRDTMLGVADAQAAMSPDVHGRLFTAAVRERAWPALITVVAASAPEHRRIAADLDDWTDDLLAHLLRAAKSNGTLAELHAFVEAADDKRRAQIAALDQAADPEIRTAIGDLLA